MIGRRRLGPSKHSTPDCPNFRNAKRTRIWSKILAKAYRVEKGGTNMSSRVPDAASPKPNPPAKLRTLLTTCPMAGSGVHRWLYGASRGLHLAQVDKREIAGLLEAATANCGRAVSAQEIQDAILSSERDLRTPGAGNSAEHRKAKWPEPKQDRIKTIAKDGPGLDGLRAISPVTF